MNIETLVERVEGICERLERIEKTMESRYVTKQEFDPVKLIVFSGAGIVLTAAVISVLHIISK